MQMKWSGGGSRFRGAVLVSSIALALTACGNSRSASPARAEQGSLGAACGEARPVASSDFDVDEDAPECGGGVCAHGASVALGAGTSAGMCTCRCDGATGTGPFCACALGFVCRQEVQDLGLSEPALSGSYCVPAN